MRILIADDEKPARGELLYMLQQLESSAQFFQARNGQETLACVAEHPIDVLFLDINMPGMNGLQVAATILEKPDPPLIVFATAYDAHAVRAFELAALDYIVKPFSERRLAQTMVRIRQALAQQEEHTRRQAALHSYLQETMPQEQLSKLWCERENKTGVLVDYGAILWVEAEGKRVFVQTQDGERLVVRYTLKELAERLRPHHILRVHKAYLANLDHVAEIVPWFSGTYLLRMADPNRTEIPMSRQYARALKQWIG